MDVKALAQWLLLGHVISEVFIALVLVQQARLFRRDIQRDLLWVRRWLFALAVAIFVGNWLPILIDAATIFDLAKRSTNHINPLGVAYGISNAVIFVFSAALIWVIYKLVSRVTIESSNDKAKEVQ